VVAAAVPTRPSRPSRSRMRASGSPLPSSARRSSAAATSPFRRACVRSGLSGRALGPCTEAQGQAKRTGSPWQLCTLVQRRVAHRDLACMLTNANAGRTKLHQHAACSLWEGAGVAWGGACRFAARHAFCRRSYSALCSFTRRASASDSSGLRTAGG